LTQVIFFNYQNEAELFINKLTSVAILGPGDSFGELSLLNSKKRAATIRCLDQPTEFLTL